MSHSSLVKPPADPVSLQKRVVLDLHNVENVSSYEVGGIWIKINKDAKSTR